MHKNVHHAHVQCEVRHMGLAHGRIKPDVNGACCGAREKGPRDGGELEAGELMGRAAVSREEVKY